MRIWHFKLCNIPCLSGALSRYEFCNASCVNVLHNFVQLQLVLLHVFKRKVKNFAFDNYTINKNARFSMKHFINIQHYICLITSMQSFRMFYDSLITNIFIQSDLIVLCCSLKSNNNSFPLNTNGFVFVFSDQRCTFLRVQNPALATQNINKKSMFY